MEKCEVEINEESKIKMEAEGDFVQKLGNHLGKLLFILELAGIPINEEKRVNKRGYILDLIKKWCFPIFLHLSCLYLLYERLSKAGLNYETVIDTILPILPCVMWIMLRCQTASLKLFLAELSSITSSNFKSNNRSLSCCANAGVCFIFFYPLLLLGMRFLQENMVNVKEVFRILQEALFPCTMVVLYTTICYLILQKLHFCKKKFHKSLDLTNPTAVNMLKDYLNVTKCVDKFENILCNIIFVIFVHDLCVVTILLFDIFLVPSDFVTFILYEALTEMLYALFSLGIMAVCAGSVSFEVAAIKSLLSETMFTQLDQGDASNNEKRINLLLKRDVSVLSVGKTVSFDRGFILKALLVVLGEVILIGMLTS